MDEPAFPGCKLTRRIIGVIEGEQGGKKQTERNDCVVAVEDGNHSYAHVKRVDDLGKRFERELEKLFVNYHRLSNEQYRILAQGSCQRTAVRETGAETGSLISP